ncbi:MAG: GIY-YIG nuclease family protein [Ignavibacteria bacterium]|nr:GIY-YIG nuclease family protein [Ignavibacteria bacterium]
MEEKTEDKKDKIEFIDDKDLNPTLKEKLNSLPSSPGVYQFRDSAGKLLYIGKAAVLKNRVKQYFQSKPVSPMISAMIRKISDIELITTDNEVEALILEQNLIRTHKPRYNINFKDDKSYPYIVITNEPFPRIFPTRKKEIRRVEIFWSLHRCQEYEICSEDRKKYFHDKIMQSESHGRCDFQK